VRAYLQSQKLVLLVMAAATHCVQGKLNERLLCRSYFLRGVWGCNNIQMMHGSEWTLKCDEPEVENVARGRMHRLSL